MGIDFRERQQIIHHAADIFYAVCRIIPKPRLSAARSLVPGVTGKRDIAELRQTLGVETGHLFLAAAVGMRDRHRRIRFVAVFIIVRRQIQIGRHTDAFHLVFYRTDIHLARDIRRDGVSIHQTERILISVYTLFFQTHSRPPICQTFFLHPLIHHVGDILIVQIGHQEMRVSLDSDIRQIDDLDIAAVPLHDRFPFPGQIQPHPPIIQSPMGIGLASGLDIVAEIHHHGNLQQFLEIRITDFHSGCGKRADGRFRLRHLAFRKRKCPRFQRDDALHLIGMRRRKPARTAAGRMRNQDTVACFFHDSHHGLCHQRRIECAGIGRHLIEKLRA